MQVIIDGGDRASREERVEELFPKTKTSIIVIEKEKTSIKVATIRSLITSLATSTSITRLIWIPEADTLTTASQNTLLKVLEEPPKKTHFALGLDNYRSLLPTIISRCEHIQLANTSTSPDQEILSVLKAIMAKGPGGRLAEAVKIGKDRESVGSWFATLLQSLSTTIKSTSAVKSLSLIGGITKLALTAQDQLSRNGNVTLTRDHFFLSLPRTK